MSDWALLFLLPNLDLQGSTSDQLAALSLDSHSLAIVPPTDRRVQSIAARSKDANAILNAFRNSHGERVDPACLIGSVDAARAICESSEAIFGFRNAVAMTHLLFARVTARKTDRRGQIWSDSWDIHPTTVGKSGSHLVTYSPAVTGFWDDALDYHGATSDYLPSHISLPRPDTYLVRALGSAWRQRFESDNPRDDRFTRTIFRSLEVAFEASRIGGRHYGSYYEYGISIALWVSAIEILAAPAPTRRERKLQPGQKRRKQATSNVTPRMVVELLGEFGWRDPLFRRKGYVAVLEKDRREKLNLVQRVYMRLYRARSKFLHGDRVAPNDLTNRSRDRPPLTRLAAYVYWTTLRAYLQRRYRDPLWDLFDRFDVERSFRLEMRQRER